MTKWPDTEPSNPTELAFVGFVATGMAIFPVGIQQLIEIEWRRSRRAIEPKIPIVPIFWT
jgi:hypothetical protein